MLGGYVAHPIVAVGRKSIAKDADGLLHHVLVDLKMDNQGFHIAHIGQWKNARGGKMSNGDLALVEQEAREVVKTNGNGGDITPNNFDIPSMLSTAGKVELTEEQRKVLYAPVNENDVEIRPDGLIYLPWMEYASRLTEAFGMGWAIIPSGLPKLHGNYIFWGFHLIVQGHLCGFAIGEQLYQPNNRTMTYGDAAEGAKSNALMRLCKGIGISLELWRPSFVRAWKEKFAETYVKDGKKLWRRRENVAKTTAKKQAEAVEKPKEIKQSQPKVKGGKVSEWHKSMTIAKEIMGEEVYYTVLGDMGYNKRTDIPNGKQEEVLQKLRDEFAKPKQDEFEQMLEDEIPDA